ncbi:hypothetical protein [Dyadobacter bucti]|uniref:hypothetical protein n=1 Tax=Dyadobacter bucti TaxID=2572203 RepID=UPI001107E596|nr:hypothetical protein [Dyadobacter bucti]
MKSKMIASIAAIMVIALSAFTSPSIEEGKPLGKMSGNSRLMDGNIGHQYEFNVLPGQKVTIKVTINCLDEHELKIYTKDKKQLHSIRKPKEGCTKVETFELFNRPDATGAVNVIPLTIKDWLPPHKAFASGRLLNQNENSATLGFEDGPDNNYADTIVEINVSNI